MDQSSQRIAEAIEKIADQIITVRSCIETWATFLKNRSMYLIFAGMLVFANLDKESQEILKKIWKSMGQ